MKEFPEFMQKEENLVPLHSQFTQDIEGYYYEGRNGDQAAFWTCYSDRISEKHNHDFDEYMICISGQVILIVENSEFVLNPGDEILISGGSEHYSKSHAGTRTIHVFGGKRIQHGQQK